MEVRGGSMEVSMEVRGGLHGGPWRSVDVSMEVRGAPWRSVEVHGNLHGGPWRSVEVSMEVSMEAHGAP